MYRSLAEKMVMAQNKAVNTFKGNVFFEKLQLS